MEPVRCANCQSLQRRVHDLQAENERLRRQLDAALCAGKRQAGPFAKGQPKANPRKPGRKPGRDYGIKAHRQPPSPEQIDEVHEAPLPEVCPDCGGALLETHVAQQFQVEIRAGPFTGGSTFTSASVVNAGAAFKDAIPCKRPTPLAPQPRNLGPMPRPPSSNSTNRGAYRTARSRAVWRAFSGFRSVAAAASTPSCGPPPAASRSTSPSARPWVNPTGLYPMRPAGEWADTLPGCTRWSDPRLPLTSSTRPVAAPWPRPSWGLTTTAP